MNWDRLDIHIENMAPGLATVWAVLLMWQPPTINSNAMEVVLGASFVGAAYLVGVLVNVLCRALLDWVSEHWTRVYIFKAFCGDKLRDMKGASREDINRAYNYYCEKAKKGTRGTAREVSKRRQTGRLLRSSLVPIVLLLFYVGINQAMRPWLIAACLVLVYLVLLLLYGYAEATVLHEAYFAVPPGERSVTRIKQMASTQSQGWTGQPMPAASDLPPATSGSQEASMA